jgi:hypothetical protein
MENHNQYYAAYGANLNRAQMAARCPDARLLGVSTIANYRLLFRGEHKNAYATIEPSANMESAPPHNAVPVAVWELTESDELALDVYEDFPRLYRKERISLPLGDQTIIAMVYIMNGSPPLGRPSNGYYRTIYNGYKQLGLDTATLDRARRASSGVSYNNE